MARKTKKYDNPIMAIFAENLDRAEREMQGVQAGFVHLEPDERLTRAIRDSLDSITAVRELGFALIESKTGKRKG